MFDIYKAKIVPPFYLQNGKVKLSVQKIIELLEKNGFRRNNDKFIKVQNDRIEQVNDKDMKLFIQQFIYQYFENYFSYYFKNKNHITKAVFKKIKSIKCKE